MNASSSSALQTPALAVSETTAPTFYRPELDLLRFLAFFSVYLFHGLWFAAMPIGIRFGLQSGMCLFFMLSSYLITELLLRERANTGRIHIEAFFIRRILRIWPLYFACLALAVLTGLIWKDFRYPWRCLVAYLLLAGNWYNVLIGRVNSPWQPLWSINVEEQFYLLWPFLARVSVRYLWAVSIATFPVAALAFAYWAGKVTDGPYGIPIWFNSFVQFQYFGLGAILALVLHGRTPSFLLSIRLLLIAASLGVFYTAATVLAAGNAKDAGSLIAGYLLIACACTALFLGLLGIERRYVPQWGISLGKISYGLYVFHVPTMFLTYRVLYHVRPLRDHPTTLSTLHLVLALPLTYLAAKLSSHYFEMPFLRLKKRFEFIKTRAVE